MDNLLPYTISTILGMFLYRLYVFIYAYILHRRRLGTYPGVLKATPDNICNGPHKWNHIKLVLANLPIDNYTVCVDCGFISRTDFSYKLNYPALEVFRGHLLRRELRLQRYQSALLVKQEESDLIMNRLIRKHVERLNTDLHSNINVMQEFFKQSTLELDSLYKKLNSVLDEGDQDDLDG